MQHITYNEYLPIILGPLYTRFYGLPSRTFGYNFVYNPNIDTSIVNVFAASALRFGHSQVPDIAAKATQNFFHYGQRNLENTFFKPNIYLSEPNGEGANAISRWSVSTRNLVTDRSVQWGAARQNQQNDLCAQQRLRSAWASAQSDQSLRCPYKEAVGPSLPIERTSNTLISRTGRMPRLIWVFTGWTSHFVGLVVLWLKSVLLYHDFSACFQCEEHFTCAPFLQRLIR